MKSFVLRELRILSRRENSAIRIAFHPKVTIIKGENDTGKSSLMKTLYWTLGCEPAKTNSSWNDLDICAAVGVEKDGQQLTFVRHAKRVGLFDSSGSLLRVFSKVSGDLAEFIATEFSFGLLLNKRESEEPEIPPPAFYLLPYCFDQDASWASPWSAFGNLTQYASWKQAVAGYHAGYLDSRYYEAKARLRALGAAQLEPEREERGLERAIDHVKRRFALTPVELDLERFYAETSVLLEHARRLAEDQDRYRSQMAELVEKRAFATAQLRMAKTVLASVTQDYRFAITQPDCVDCPTCGAVYKNSILERFDLAVDQLRCEELVVELGDEIETLERKMTLAERDHSESISAAEKVASVLSTKRGEVTLHQLIQGEARGEAIGALEQQLAEVRRSLDRLREDEQSIKSTIKSYESTSRKRKFLDRLFERVSHFSVELNVASPIQSRDFSFKIAETGSDSPRAILAYQFAILSLAFERDDAVHAPLCIDSPNQQDQDTTNYRAMLEFIRDKRHPDQQLILALVDTAGVAFSGDVIELTSPRMLLDPALDSTVGAELRVMLTKMYTELSE